MAPPALQASGPCSPSGVVAKLRKLDLAVLGHTLQAGQTTKSQPDSAEKLHLTIVWCAACGAYSESRLDSLVKPCPGKPGSRGKDNLARFALLLHPLDYSSPSRVTDSVTSVAKLRADCTIVGSTELYSLLPPLIALASNVSQAAATTYREADPVGEAQEAASGCTHHPLPALASNELQAEATTCSEAAPKHEVQGAAGERLVIGSSEAVVECAVEIAGNNDMPLIDCALGGNQVMCCDCVSLFPEASVIVEAFAEPTCVKVNPEAETVPTQAAGDTAKANAAQSLCTAAAYIQTSHLDVPI